MSDQRPVVLPNSWYQLLNHIINKQLKRIVEQANVTVLEPGQGQCVNISTTTDMEARDGEKSRQAAAQIAEWLAAAWNRPAYDALAGVCSCSGRARPCSGAANVASDDDDCFYYFQK